MHFRSIRDGQILFLWHFCYIIKDFRYFYHSSSLIIVHSFTKSTQFSQRLYEDLEKQSQDIELQGVYPQLPFLITSLQLLFKRDQAQNSECRTPRGSPRCVCQRHCAIQWTQSLAAVLKPSQKSWIPGKGLAITALVRLASFQVIS